MMEALRPSIEEAQPINTQELALDYIGKRANQVRGGGMRRRARSPKHATQKHTHHTHAQPAPTQHTHAPKHNKNTH